MTGLFHGNKFFQTWWIIEPTSDDPYHDGGLVTTAPSERDFKYWKEHNFKPVHVIEHDAYAKLKEELDVQFAEATKWYNAYQSKAVTMMIQNSTIEELQEGQLKLWGLNMEQLLMCVNYYQMQTGEDLRTTKTYLEKKENE